MRLGGTEVEPIELQRGMPQGSKCGQKQSTAVLRACLATVWASCQRGRLGYQLEALLVPFACFRDSIFIFARSATAFLEIARRLKTALERAGWRLPDDRIEY